MKWYTYGLTVNVFLQLLPTTKFLWSSISTKLSELNLAVLWTWTLKTCTTNAFSEVLRASASFAAVLLLLSYSWLSYWISGHWKLLSAFATYTKHWLAHSWFCSTLISLLSTRALQSLKEKVSLLPKPLCVCVTQELQTSILNLATKILVGCDEVLETLQQVTTALINSDISDRESRYVQMGASPTV